MWLSELNLCQQTLSCTKKEWRECFRNFSLPVQHFYTPQFVLVMLAGKGFHFHSNHSQQLFLWLVKKITPGLSLAIDLLTAIVWQEAEDKPQKLEIRARTSIKGHTYRTCTGLSFVHPLIVSHSLSPILNPCIIVSHLFCSLNIIIHLCVSKTMAHSDRWQ